jgi:pimeloyl-ACP methyl ester carboxylesterase
LSNSNGFRVKEFGPQSEKVIFFFTILNTRIWLYWWPIRVLTRGGYRVVAYDYSSSLVLNGDVARFLAVSDAIQADLQARMLAYKEVGTRSFYAFGSSMGTIFAIVGAANIQEISKVVLNLTYGSLAETVWSWWYLRRTKQEFMRRGISMRELEQLLVPVSPIPNAKKLKGTDVLLYLSKRDKVLLFAQSSRFKAALDEAGVRYTYYENRYLGHISSVVVNFWRRQRYMDFFDAPQS